MANVHGLSFWPRDRQSQTGAGVRNKLQGRNADTPAAEYWSAYEFIG